MPMTLPSTGILMGATDMVHEWIDCAFCGDYLAKLFGSICLFQMNGSYKLPTYIPTCKNTETNACHGAPKRKLNKLEKSIKLVVFQPKPPSSLCKLAASLRGKRPFHQAMHTLIQHVHPRWRSGIFVPGVGGFRKGVFSLEKASF